MLSKHSPVSTVEVTFLTSAALIFVTGLIIAAINPWRLINRSYLIAATLSALWLICIFVAIHIGQSTSHESREKEILFWLRMSNAVAAFLPCSYFLIKTAITGTKPATVQSNRVWLWILASCMLATLAFSESFIPSYSTTETKVRGVGYVVYTVSQSILCASIIFGAFKELHKCRGISLLELKFFLINCSLATLVVLFTFVTSSALTIQSLRYAAPFVVAISFSLTIWAICYHRVFDARQVFATLCRRITTLVALTGCIHVADSYLEGVIDEPAALTISVTIGALFAIFWDRKITHWLKLDAKLILAGPRAQIIEWAHEEADANKLMTKFEAFLRDWCQTSSVSFHTSENSVSPTALLNTSDFTKDFPLLRQTGYITPETLIRRRPDSEISLGKAVLFERNLAALIAVPRGSHSPSCVVTFGHKRSLRPYTYPDIQLLIEMIELMDNILAQARVAERTAQIEKMEAAAMMSRGLAHDLNNLATPVSSFLLHMENRVADGSPEAEVLAHAKHSIKVMQDYIRESLFFARRLVPDLQTLSTSELVNSSVMVTRSRAHARNVKVAIDGLIDLSFVADRPLILRLLQNLILNGIDATPSGGQVTLAAGGADDDKIVFSVVDQGTGVPAGHMDRIFEPYFTTKVTGSDVRGLGLGLAISQKISALHGGELKVGKASCGGAIFTFTLPANLKKAGLPAPELAPA